MKNKIFLIVIIIIIFCDSSISQINNSDAIVDKAVSFFINNFENLSIENFNSIKESKTRRIYVCTNHNKIDSNFVKNGPLQEKNFFTSDSLDFKKYSANHKLILSDANLTGVEVKYLKRKKCFIVNRKKPFVLLELSEPLYFNKDIIVRCTITSNDSYNLASVFLRYNNELELINLFDFQGVP